MTTIESFFRYYLKDKWILKSNKSIEKEQEILFYDNSRFFIENILSYIPFSI
jgi:hypothetical protein